MSRWIIMATDRACACLSHRAASVKRKQAFHAPATSGEDFPGSVKPRTQIF